MNSEELEQSLRTEFESYLRNILADMRQEVSQFQQKIDTELEKHKSYLDEVFKDFSARIETDKELDEGFRESVVEHLRLARDEGATITAKAIAEAEELAEAENRHTEEIAASAAASATAAAVSVEAGDIRDAIYDISSQNSQSAILKSLIDHAAKFTPRGAFFVVKNQHFVGWRVFGKQKDLEDGSIGEIVFPVEASTIMGDSVNSLSVIESSYGNYPEDNEFLLRLDFGKPSKMFAIPLIARGRGVAAIYADSGQKGEKVDIEALETLISVAGLTVELLAAAQNNQFTRGVVKTVAHPAPASQEEIPESVRKTTEIPQPEAVEAVAEEPEKVQAAAEVEVAKEVESARVYEEPDEVEEVTYHEEPDEVEAKAAEAEAAEAKAAEAKAAEAKAAEAKAAEAKAAEAEAAEAEAVEAKAAEAKAAEAEAVSAVSDDFAESKEPAETAEPQEDAVVEESYSLSTEPEDSIESVEKGFTTNDDDLIEEVQTQPETVEESTEEKSEPVYQAAEADKETAGEAVDAPSASPVSEVTAEPTDSLPEELNAEYDDSIYQPVAERSDSSESFSIPSPSQHQFETNQDFNSSPVQFEEPAGVEIPQTETADETIEDVSVAQTDSFESFEISEGDSAAEEPVEEAVSEPVSAPPPARTRFSERNVDLPIDVSEDERRLHNDARRFARLLISEIKLYNEQKVKEGRESGDLYERLHEAIDRSREMYDKRVQPTVVKRFDYFHYEVVNNLADGEEASLGSNYPGATE